MYYFFSVSFLQTELSEDSPYPKKVSWLSSSFGAFYAMPGDFRLAQSPAYQQGRIYGQDVSSGVAVALLMKEEDEEESDNRTSDINSLEHPALPKKPLRILDLCCAPGLKLCALADWLVELQQSTTTSSTTSHPSVVVGVDLHRERLDVAKNVIYKYHLDPDTRGPNKMMSNKKPASSSDTSCKEADVKTPIEQSSSAASIDLSQKIRIRLFQGDGTTIFSSNSSTDRDSELIFDSLAAWEEQLSANSNGTERKRRNNKSSRARERKRLKLLQEEDLRQRQHYQNSEKNNDNHLFDRVLVDAECSTDGSIKHVQKVLEQHANSQQKESVSNNIISLLNDKAKLNALHSLQQRLAFNGFRLLRPGGSMVYSTCSLEEGQNEDIVRSLLKVHTNAVLVPVSVPVDSPLVVEGSLKGTIRFLPNTNHKEELLGGGFFIAKIRKTLE